MLEKPDITQQHILHYCKYCGESLENVKAIPAGKRQVFDIPKIEIKVTEHQVYSKQCQCGHINYGEYPTQANAPVSYDNNIESLIVYFTQDNIFHSKGYRRFLKTYLVLQ